MMRRFHDGALEALSPWRLFEEPRSSCVRCARTVFCNAGLRTVSCAYPNASCQGGGGGGGGGIEVLRRYIAETTWPIFVPQPPSSSTFSCPTDRRSWSKGSPRNASSSETGNRIDGADPMPFSITSILGRQAAAAAAASEDRNQATSQRKIVRPWDDKVTDRGRSKTLRKSSTKIDGSDDDDEEEEISVGQDGARSAGRLESTGNKDCPLGALLRMTSRKQFERLDTAASGYTTDDSGADNNTNQLLSTAKSSPLRRSTTQPIKKRRKTRTAFTNHQIFQLEKHFLYQKYLTPADRDELAISLRLSNSQVITWFQNRRAKLKRDLEELRADVTAAKSLGTEPSTVVLGRLDELLRTNVRALKRKDKNIGDTSGRSSSSSFSNRNSKSTCKSDESVVSTTVQDIAI